MAKKKTTKSKEKFEETTEDIKEIIDLTKKEPSKRTKEQKVSNNPVVTNSRVPTVSFAKWFKARAPEKGWKAHWMDGMRKFTDTAGRLPMEEWDRRFENY